jgi:hypothetical protein
MAHCVDTRPWTTSILLHRKLFFYMTESTVNGQGMVLNVHLMPQSLFT